MNALILQNKNKKMKAEEPKQIESVQLLSQRSNMNSAKMLITVIIILIQPSFTGTLIKFVYVSVLF